MTYDLLHIPLVTFFLKKSSNYELLYIHLMTYILQTKAHVRTIVVPFDLAWNLIKKPKMVKIDLFLLYLIVILEV